MTVLLDTNVLLDYLQARPDFESAEKIINLCASKKLTGFMAAHSVPDMYYILRKFFSDSDRRDMILSLIDIVPVAEINHAKIASALANNNFLILKIACKMNVPFLFLPITLLLETLKILHKAKCLQSRPMIF